MNRFKCFSPFVQQLGKRSYCSRSALQRGVNQNGQAALCRVVSGHQYGSNRSESSAQAKPSTRERAEGLLKPLAYVGAGVLTLYVAWKAMRDPKKQALTPVAHVPLVVIGSGTTAVRAAQGARLQDPKAKVAIFTEDKYLPYKTSPLLGSLWYMPDEYADRLEITSVNSDGKRRTNSVFYENENYYMSLREVLDNENGGVAILKNRKVKEIRKKPKQLILDNGFVIQYDKCVVVADNVPQRKAKIENSLSERARDRISYYHSVDDFKKLKKLAKKGASIAIVGGGRAACSLAQALMAQADGQNGTQVCQIFEDRGIMADMLPQYLSKFATEELSKDAKIDMFSRSMLGKVTNENGQLCLELLPPIDPNVKNVKSKKVKPKKVYADHVVMMDSLVPDTRFAGDVGLPVMGKISGMYGGDDFYAGDDMWVAGEGVYFYDPQTCAVRRVEGDEQKELSGRIAGYNMAGGKRKFQRQPVTWGNLSPNVSFLSLGNCNPNLKTISYFSAEEDLKYKGPGVVFYVNTDLDRVVGVMMWNLHGHHTYYGEDLARRMLKSKLSCKDVDNLAKEFKLNTFEEFKEVLMKRWEAQEDDDDLGMSAE